MTATEHTMSGYHIPDSDIWYIHIGVNTPVRKSAGSNPVFVYVFKAN